MEYIGGILYSQNNYEISYTVQKICKEKKINLILTSNYLDLISSYTQFRPTYVFFDLQEPFINDRFLFNFPYHNDAVNCKNIVLFYSNNSSRLKFNNKYTFVHHDTLYSDLKSFLTQSLNTDYLNLSFSKKELISPCSENINRLLLNNGFSLKLLGFVYMKECLVELLKNCEYLKSLNKNIYPRIACRFKTSVSSVERCIRTAIENASLKNCINSGNFKDLNSKLSNKSVITFFVDQLSNTK